MKKQFDDLIEDAEADIDDLISGRVKDLEHLVLAQKLLEHNFELENSLGQISDSSQEELYERVNDKSNAELTELFNKMDEFRKFYNKFFKLKNR